ncbi:MAG: hypothetical protein OEY55_04015 [Acidimicrobiia bacterium]|nr:hypothetical protein [Acidimicrobiia bacterium]MDH5504014.1 hypothetical protein [Acidimicrobiia bacterium]
MSDSVSDEPALNGASPETQDRLEDESALTGRVPIEQRLPIDALGNEPALQSDGRLPNYAEVYQQFRSGTPVSWGTAALVTLASAMITFGVMLVPVGLMLARLYDGFFLPIRFLGFGTYFPAVIGVLLVAPALVWVEVRPWTVPNALALGTSAGGPGLLAGLWLASVGATHENGSIGVIAVGFLAFILPAGLSALGVVHVWRRTDREGRVPAPGLVTPFAIAAGIVAMIGVMTAWSV